MRTKGVETSKLSNDAKQVDKSEYSYCKILVVQ
jgi:hypothetical protein